MFMVSPCIGCDTVKLGQFLAIIETLSGVATIMKSMWWYFKFKVSSQLDEVITFSCEEQSLQECQIEINLNQDEDADEVENSYTKKAYINNFLWASSGFLIGSLNVALGLLLMIGLTSVNYILLVMWCISLPITHLLDCLLLTFTLDRCTSRERFERCKIFYITNTICAFVFNAYMLWVGMSVIDWCHCRKDPYECKFEKSYCHSFNLTADNDRLLGD